MQQDNDPSPPPPHKYFFTYLYIDTNTDHVVLLFPFILYFIICCSCFHRSNPFLLFCGGAGERFGRSLSMFALSSPHDLDEMTFLFRQIWEKTNRGHRSDSPPRPSHQHEAVSCQASTKLTTVRPKPAWKSSFLRTIRSSRRAHSGSDAAQKPFFKTRAQRNGVKTLQGENDLEFASSEFQLYKSSLWKMESTFNKSPKNITRKTIAPR